MRSADGLYSWSAGQARLGVAAGQGGAAAGEGKALTRYPHTPDNAGDPISSQIMIGNTRQAQ